MDTLYLDNDEWKLDAACMGLWDVYDLSQSPATNQAIWNKPEHSQALQLCYSCPVQDHCHQYTTTINQRIGLTMIHGIQAHSPLHQHLTYLKNYSQPDTLTTAVIEQLIHIVEQAEKTTKPNPNGYKKRAITPTIYLITQLIKGLDHTRHNTGVVSWPKLTRPGGIIHTLTGDTSKNYYTQIGITDSHFQPRALAIRTLALFSIITIRNLNPKHQPYPLETKIRTYTTYYNNLAQTNPQEHERETLKLKLAFLNHLHTLHPHPNKPHHQNHIQTNPNKKPKPHQPQPLTQQNHPHHPLQSLNEIAQYLQQWNKKIQPKTPTKQQNPYQTAIHILNKLKPHHPHYPNFTKDIHTLHDTATHFQNLLNTTHCPKCHQPTNPIHHTHTLATPPKHHCPHCQTTTTPTTYKKQLPKNTPNPNHLNPDTPPTKPKQ